jgi:hypothetical protein
VSPVAAAVNLEVFVVLVIGAVIGWLSTRKARLL